MSEYKVKAPRKLIEVALPLKEINEACVSEKTIRHGHPSSLHLYWARRPLAAARAILFAQLVNDPEYDYENKKRPVKEAKRERVRLFSIISDLVKWENTNNIEILKKAQEEIRKSWVATCNLNKGHPQASELFNPEKIPAIHDPFAGGGSIPLEAQRLGLEAWASDLNPVSVLINKAMIEIPPKFVDKRPIGPIPIFEKQREIESFTWQGITGLAEDVRRYGHLVRDEVVKRIGYLYPQYEVTSELVQGRPDLKRYQGQKLPIIAWIWARTVKSPDPRFHHIDIPLASTFVLSSKSGKEAFIHPVVFDDGFRFDIKLGRYPSEAINGTKLARGAKFKCLMSNTPIDDKYIKSEGLAGRLGSKLMAVVAEGVNSRVYLPPTEEMERYVINTPTEWIPEQKIPGDLRAFWTPSYGLTHFHHLFTNRQLAAITCFSDVINDVRDKIFHDAIAAGWKDDNLGMEYGGTGAKAYSEAVGLCLSFALSKLADLSNSLCRWENIAQCPRNLFGRQAIPMIWDYAEGNVIGSSSGSWLVILDGFVKAYKSTFSNVAKHIPGAALQADAHNQNISKNKIVSTDPPYYDNIGYADLSDFFYIWLRRSLKPVFPNLFGTMSTPKNEELVASPYRHGGKKQSEDFFLNGMSQALLNLSQQTNPSYPITIYYAFKQSDSTKEGTSSTGWITFLEAVIHSGLYITGTWPIRTENNSRMIGQGTNALASSIVLVCRKRDEEAAIISRKDFLQELKLSIPLELDNMINVSEASSPITPVDLAQSAIGPGMAIYSKYKAILESDGTYMSVHSALIQINKEIDNYFDTIIPKQDSETRFCLAWFSEYGWKEGPFGEAEVLAKAKGLSVEGVRDSGVLIAGSGKVRLFRPAEYPSDWNPLKDDRTPVWEVLHQLIRAHQSSGESAAAAIASAVPELAATARQLAFLLYTLCERQGWAEDARPYNDLVTAWLSIEKQAQKQGIKNEQIEAEFK